MLMTICGIFITAWVVIWVLVCVDVLYYDTMMPSMKKGVYFVIPALFILWPVMVMGNIWAGMSNRSNNLLK